MDQKNATPAEIVAQNARHHRLVANEKRIEATRAMTAAEEHEVQAEVWEAALAKLTADQ
jgi:hypothetical protein